MRTAKSILDEHLHSMDWNKQDPQLRCMYLRALDAIDFAQKDAVSTSFTDEKIKERTPEHGC